MLLKSNQLNESLIRRIETRTGKSVEELKDESLWQKRLRLSQAKGKAMRFTRNFPLIGRGCVLGDHLADTHAINHDVDQLLGRR